jgi:flagellar biosynthesis protein FlhA
MMDYIVQLPDDLTLELGYGLIPLVDKDRGAELMERIQGVRSRIAFDLGLAISRVRILDNLLLEPSEYCINIRGVDVGRGKIHMGYLLCINPGTVAVEIEGEKTVDPAFGQPALWISADRRDEAKQAGYTVADPPVIIATHLTEIIKHNTGGILGLQNTQDILDSLREEYPAVVDAVKSTEIRVVEIQKVLHGLLKEQVSIRNIVSILESIAYYAPFSRDIPFLTERARHALSNQICRQHAGKDNRLRVLTLNSALEQKIIESKVATSSGVVAALDPPTHTMWIKALVKAIAGVRKIEEDWMPLILCSEQARFLVKDSTSRELPELAVVSVQEIADGFTVKSMGEISIDEVEKQSA